jgi:lactoylglutathione lyase
MFAGNIIKIKAIDKMQINHIAIWTNDLEKEKDFYVKYFDCNVNDKYDNSKKQFSSYFLTFSCGCRIELMKRNNIGEFAMTDLLGLTHIAITVGTRDKVDNLTKELENDGYAIFSYPRLTGDGYYESVILDPEHNQIELVSIDDYQISKAKHENLEEILYLQKCCYLTEAEIYNDYNIPPLKQDLIGIKVDFDNQIILKLECNNKIIGSVRGFIKNDTCYIGKLIVAKEYQNMGFGKRLMIEIENQFKGANRFELFTGCRSEKNLYLYNKLGYKEFKSERMNDLVMKYLEKGASR